MHEHLLIGSDSFLLELGTRACIAHEISQICLCVSLIEEIFAAREESSEFTQIEACDGLALVHNLLIHIPVGLFFKDIDQDVDAFQVIGVVEHDERCLPEFLCVNRRPGETTSLHLLLPFVEG